MSKSVGIDDVIQAIRIRESGGTWNQVIAATGFNGATLRPHITEYLQREVLGRAATEKGDRVDSPYAVVQSVELTTESIDDARRRGMAWYSIAKALGISEAKVKGLASPESRRRVYAGVKGGAKATVRIGRTTIIGRVGVNAVRYFGAGEWHDTADSAQSATAKAEKNRKARERRAAKRAAKATA